MSGHHTPGPWRFVRDGGDDVGRIVGSDGTTVMSFGDSTTYYPTAGSEPEGEDMALTLAATDLLEAAAYAEDVISSEYPPGADGVTDNLSEALRMLRAAIAKAEGQP